MPPKRHWSISATTPPLINYGIIKHKQSSTVRLSAKEEHRREKQFAKTVPLKQLKHAKFTPKFAMKPKITKRNPPNQPASKSHELAKIPSQRGSLDTDSELQGAQSGPQISPMQNSQCVECRTTLESGNMIGEQIGRVKKKLTCTRSLLRFRRRVSEWVASDAREAWHGTGPSQSWVGSRFPMPNDRVTWPSKLLPRILLYALK